jgi:4-hydroxy-tetrahydrodipicolinate reductase
VALDLLQLPPISSDDASWSHARVLMDASHTEAVEKHARRAAEERIAMLVAVTGLSPEAERSLDETSRRVPVLVSPNLSLGVALLARFVREAAARLSSYDVEVVEAHHAAKKDSPSGTALWLAGEAARARGWAWPEAARSGREGPVGPRPEREIGVHSLRAGSVAGEHHVWLGGPGEHLELTHVAESRECFAAGAVEALAYLASAPPGRYTMEDVTGTR